MADILERWAAMVGTPENPSGLLRQKDEKNEWN